MRTLIIAFMCFFSMLMGQSAQASALGEAARAGDVTLVNKLLGEGAQVHDGDENGQTALHHAVSSGHVNVVRVLLANGADASLQDENDRSAFDLALEKDNASLVEAMLQSDLDPNTYNHHSIPFLSRAAMHNSLKSMKLLIKYGADINAPERVDEWTPLIFAARGMSPDTGNVEAVRMLLAHGANVHTKDDAGKTALDHAMGKSKNEAVVNLLKQAAGK